ncbi:MAG: AbrB/MazE/SpoVT family DNA-binding domain-containing protein [Methylophilus methylotrophus]|jgi:AbrB family looped-hinge helix DNA binding protein|uniref:AbrB/MazE/SpoVT family DNA-binding domain-containing protein n=1 Tax=Methylophilus methylotrophus TaxID=17 RepID=A0A5C7WK39_METME|nr:MAG: AbrB/MazE/SpoVT family DNA-binding domain-containing protein [Methylophilus methylotrophus]
MDTVTVSPKFQVVIPKQLRQSLNIQAGQKLKARIQGEHIELIPEQPMTTARGFLAGIDTEVNREEDRV